MHPSDDQANLSDLTGDLETAVDETAEQESNPADQRAVEIPGLPEESLTKHEGEFPETPVDRAFRWSTMAIGVLILATVTGTVAWQYWSVAQDVNRSINELLVYFEDGGLKVTESGPLPNKAGAEWAQYAEIAGQQIKIYQFASNTNEEQKKRLQAIRETGSIEIDGKPVPAKVNGAFVLTGYESNRQKDTLIHAFEGFGG